MHVLLLHKTGRWRNYRKYGT